MNFTSDNLGKQSGEGSKYSTNSTFVSGLYSRSKSLGKESGYIDLLRTSSQYS